MSTELNAVQPINLIAGNLGQPGAPILNMALMYDTESGSLNGMAVVSQAVTPPSGRVVINHVSGDVHGLGFGAATRVFTMQGEYVQSFPPPAIGSYLAKFTATFVTDNNWKGHGSFMWGTHKVDNVPVAPRA